MQNEPNQGRSPVQRIAMLAFVLALVVVVLGAFVRLSDAGLGCPDWPGCYGQLIAPESTADTAGYDRPIETDKAWKEMIHRYAAGILGLLILLATILAWRARSRRENQGVVLPTALLILVIFQAALGMWTVTLLLKPLVVTAHLVGGFATLSLLWLLVIRQGNWYAPVSISNAFALRRLGMIALIVLIVQIVLGAWTSSNYAALVCPDFPQCQGQLWPQMDFGEAFVLWRGLGVDYEGGVLHGAARTAIHVTHRIGAVITTLTLLVLIIRLFRERDPTLRGEATVLLLLLSLQIGIAIWMVTHQMPLAFATAHNAIAALLLLAVVTINHSLRTVPMLRYS